MNTLAATGSDAVGHLVTGPTHVTGPTAVDLRGRTTVADRVVEKIAARAALEVPHCVAPERRLADHLPGHPSVGASAQTDGTVTGLRLSVAIAYPAPIVTTTRAVRMHVEQTVRTLCDMTVDHVDITVVGVVRRTPERRRVQ